MKDGYLILDILYCTNYSDKQNDYSNEQCTWISALCKTQTLRPLVTNRTAI